MSWVETLNLQWQGQGWSKSNHTQCIIRACPLFKAFSTLANHLKHLRVDILQLVISLLLWVMGSKRMENETNPLHIGNMTLRWPILWKEANGQQNINIDNLAHLSDGGKTTMVDLWPREQCCYNKEHLRRDSISVLLMDR